MKNLKNKIQLIGGPYDGKRISLENFPPEIRFPVERDKISFMQKILINHEIEVTISEYRYIRHTVSVNGNSVYVYLWEHASTQEIVKKYASK